LPVNCDPWSEWIMTRRFGLRRQTALSNACKARSVVIRDCIDHHRQSSHSLKELNQQFMRQSRESFSTKSAVLFILRSKTTQNWARWLASRVQ